jgi:hypothetical protein
MGVQALETAIETNVDLCAESNVHERLSSHFFARPLAFRDVKCHPLQSLHG